MSSSLTVAPFCTPSATPIETTDSGPLVLRGSSSTNAVDRKSALLGRFRRVRLGDSIAASKGFLKCNLRLPLSSNNAVLRSIGSFSAEHPRDEELRNPNGIIDARQGVRPNPYDWQMIPPYRRYFTGYTRRVVR